MMPAQGDKKGPPILAKGARVEIAPYGRDYTLPNLGWLDGSKGTVRSVGEGSPPRTIYVIIDGTPGAVGYPTEAVRPIHEEK